MGQMYGSDVHILTNSWFGNAFASYKAAEGFTLSNLDNHDNAEVNIWVVGLYSLSDCLAGVGAGHIYPISTIEQIVEGIMQLAGFTLTLTIAANITAAKSFMDGDKTEFLERYYNVKQFLEFFCHEVPSEITDRVKAAFQATWKNGTGTFQSHLFSGLSPALAKDVSVELYHGKKILVPFSPICFPDYPQLWLKMFRSNYIKEKLNITFLVTKIWKMFVKTLMC